MNIKSSLFCFSLIAATAVFAGGELKWTLSTETAPWTDRGVVRMSEQSEGEVISVDSNVRYQTMDKNPWGGCFNERGWQAMRDLTDAERSAVLESLFGPGPDSLHFSAGRTPVGSSDYGIWHYSYDETRGDFALKDFSIEQDRKFLLPYIKAAMKFCPDLPLFASPWTPPSWIKANGRLHGRCGPRPNIVDTPENLKFYAGYFAKYLEAYAKEGVNVVAVTPQNEPTMDTTYPSCTWTGEQLNVFLRDYLVDAVVDYNRRSGKNVQVWLGTFTDSNPTMCLPTVNDPKTGKAIAAVCFQWWGAPLCKQVRLQRPDLKLVQSESKCGDGNNNWAYAEEQFDCFKEFLDAGVSQYFLWNMVLEGRGPNNSFNGRGWTQNAPITVDGKTIRRRPSYWQVKHFSANVMPGARKIKTKGAMLGEGSVARHMKDLRAISFQNRNGEIVVNVKNSTDAERVVTLVVDGKNYPVALPAHSISTFKGWGKFEDTPDAFFDASQDPEEANKPRVKLASKLGANLVSVQDRGMHNGARIVQTSNLGEAHQTWALVPAKDGWYEFRNLNSDLAMGVFRGETHPGAVLVQWQADGSANQQWKLERARDGYCRVINRGSGLALAVRGASSDGAELTQEPRADSDLQLWKVETVSGTVEIE